MLQSRTSSSAGQAAPPEAGSTSARLRCCSPSPHSEEQALHVDHGATSQSCGTGVGAGDGGTVVGTGTEGWRAPRSGLHTGLDSTVTLRHLAMLLPDLSAQTYLIAHVPAVSRLSVETGEREPPWHDAS